MNRGREPSPTEIRKIRDKLLNLPEVTEVEVDVAISVRVRTTRTPGPFGSREIYGIERELRAEFPRLLFDFQISMKP